MTKIIPPPTDPGKREAKTIIKQPLAKTKNGDYYASESHYFLVFTTGTVVGIPYPVIQLNYFSDKITFFCSDLQEEYRFTTNLGEIFIVIKGWMDKVEVNLIR